MLQDTVISRRSFLGTAGAGLVVGFHVAGPGEARAQGAAPPEINA